MTTPIAPRPQRLELQRDTSFTAEPDKGMSLELSMLASVFKKLQDAGLIPASAKLNGKVPEAAGLKSLTYESRLRELIRDDDGNGRLDLDLERLAAAKMLVGSPTVEQLDAALSGRFAAGLQDQFLREQAPRSGLWAGTGATPRGAEAQSYSRGMVLTTDQDRATTAFVSEALTRGLGSPAEAKAVAKEAINGAAVLVGRGDGRRARELLDGTGQALAEAGRFDEAAQVFTELTRPPHAAVKKNLVQDAIDAVKAGGQDFDESAVDLKVPLASGSRVDYDPVSHRSSVGQMAQVRLSQLTLRSTMEATLGRNVDPHNVDDARAYFDAFAKGKPTAAVAAHFQDYLQAFFKHPGNGVEWTPAIPMDERAARLGELLRGQPSDAAGRTIVDCEGFAYLSAHILGGIKNEAGDPRLQVFYATRQDHIITGVVDAAAGKAFTVNNENVGAATPVKSELEIQRLIAHSLCGDRPEIFGIARTHSQSRPMTSGERSAPPVLGSLVWNGSRVIGTVTPQTQADFAGYKKTSPFADFAEYAAWRLNAK